MRVKYSVLDKMFDRGFDRSAYIGKAQAGERRAVRVSCSQCQALGINGVACHETGCPNAKHDCKGCDTLIPARQKYCEDCAI